MTSLHKEVARGLIAAIEAEGATDATVAAALRDKTAALIERVRGWLPEGATTTSVEGVAAFQAAMRSQGFAANVESFLWALAQAELAQHHAKPASATATTTATATSAPAAAAAVPTSGPGIGDAGDPAAAPATAETTMA